MIGKFALKVAVLVAGLGLLVSRVTLLQWLAGESANLDFVLWYAIFYAWLVLVVIVLFGRFDPRVFRVSLGVVLLVFATGIVFYYPASGYALSVVGANPSGTPTFLLASEDELTFTFWQWVGVADLFWLGILTYVITPFVLVLAAAVVITPQRFRNAVHALLKV